MTSAWSVAALFRSEAPKLRRFLRRFGSDVSQDDIAQESFVRLCAADHTDIESPRAFLFRTARNLALDDLRRRSAAPMRSVANIDALGAAVPDLSPEERVICAEELATLRRALEAMPIKHRKALILFKIEGLSHREIGAKLGVSHRTVARYVAEAVARCHLALRAKARKD